VRRLVIKIAVGFDSAERMQSGLSVAAAGCASGLDVSLWLAGDAAWLGVAGQRLPATLEPEAADLFATVLQQGTVVVCARCADRRGITAADLLPGAVIKGAAAFVAEVAQPDVQALVY
jgi:predicted peroxiredoxin